MARLTHLDDQGRMKMVDVGGKQSTRREAVAEARVRMSASTLDLIAANNLPKGDVLAAARLAGVMAAKQTATLIPLTHPLPLSFAEVEITLDRNHSAAVVRATARCEGKTGVEMEAMTACAIAALTLYDMCKSAEKGIIIESIRLLRKEGGKSGTWVAE